MWSLPMNLGDYATPVYFWTTRVAFLCIMPIPGDNKQEEGDRIDTQEIIVFWKKIKKRNWRQFGKADVFKLNLNKNCKI